MLPTVAKQGTAQGEHGLSAFTTPAHAGLFHTLLDNDLAGRFEGATANGLRPVTDRIASLTEEAIAHTPPVGEEIGEGLVHVIRQRCSSWNKCGA